VGMMTMQNEMRYRLYELLGECEKKYSAYYGEFVNQLNKAETQADYERIYGGVIKKHDFFADHLIENGVIVPPCKVGDEIWVVETEDGEAVDITCCMFLAKSKGCIIATLWINDYDLDETLEYHINETQDNQETGLVVYPEEYCFATKDQAEQKLKEMRGE
jgi:hypothetical protein